jgi:hypothetical protein
LYSETMAKEREQTQATTQLTIIKEEDPTTAQTTPVRHVQNTNDTGDQAYEILTHKIPIPEDNDLIQHRTRWIEVDDYEMTIVANTIRLKRQPSGEFPGPRRAFPSKPLILLMIQIANTFALQRTKHFTAFKIAPGQTIQFGKMYKEHGTLLYLWQGDNTVITRTEKNGMTLETKLKNGECGCIKANDIIPRENTGVQLQVTNNEEDEEAVLIFGRADKQLERQTYDCKWEPSCNNRACGFLHTSTWHKQWAHKTSPKKTKPKQSSPSMEDWRQP